MGWIKDLWTLAKQARQARKERLQKAPPVSGNPGQDRLPADLTGQLSLMGAIFHAPKNADYIARPFIIDGLRCAILYIDGMVDRVTLEDVVFRALQNAPAPEGPKAEYGKQVLENSLPTATGKLDGDTQAIADWILGGNFALLLDGCKDAVLCEMQGFAKRSVEQPVTESVVIGPHQAFNENLRTNLSLLRRLLKTPDLVDELVDVGKQVTNKVAICYLENLTNPELVARVKQRIEAIDAAIVYTVGELAQLIDDTPYHLLAQSIMTERPDRATSFLMDGLVLLVYDNSPCVVALPATITHFLHASEDNFLRWQYGSFMRLVRYAGILIALLLPAVYNAILIYHQELFPAALMTSLLEGHAAVPLSATVELLLMELVFDLINEASLRMPGYMGSTLGIIGALVMGQSAVSAQLISPAMLIVVSIAGLGTFALPSYPFSIALRIRRVGYILAGAFFGLPGVVLTVLLLLIRDCGQQSFGVPLFAPFAPRSPHNPDLWFRLPLTLPRVAPAALRPKQKAGKGNGT